MFRGDSCINVCFRQEKQTTNNKNERGSPRMKKISFEHQQKA